MADHPVSRRAFIVAAGGAAVGVAAAGADAFTGAPRRVEFSRHDVPVPGLPLPLQGLTIAHLSDIHLYAGIHPAAGMAIRQSLAGASDGACLVADGSETTRELLHGLRYGGRLTGHRSAIQGTQLATPRT